MTPTRSPKRKYTPGQPITTDKAIIWEIYRAKERTRFLATKYSRILDKPVTSGDIARIKGGVEPYRTIIEKAKHDTMMWLFRRQFGYDHISKYTPPPFGKDPYKSDNYRPKTDPGLYKSTG